MNRKSSFRSFSSIPNFFKAYITEFVPAVTEEPVDDEVPGGEDDLIPGTDGDSAIPDM